MIGKNEYIHSTVVTKNGIIDIDDIIPGDKVYEYNTGRLVSVVDVIKSDCTDIYKSEYTDGRFLYGTMDEISSYIVDLKALEFDNSVIRNSFYPDPYVVGALLIYGDYSKEEVTLPNDMREINDVLFYKYDLQYCRCKDKVHDYFSKHITPNIPIRWKDLFKYATYISTHDKRLPIIPQDYMYSSIKNRQQLLMGIFDLGYNPDRFPNYVAIEHWSESMLMIVREILWSLGIPSIIEYSPMKEDVTELIYDRRYVLRILGLKSKYPGFFYNREKIENVIKMNSLSSSFDMKLINTTKVCTGYISNLVLEESNIQYYTGNYLPRFSL